jgi:hypothetical protein
MPKNKPAIGPMITQPIERLSVLPTQVRPRLPHVGFGRKLAAAPFWTFATLRTRADVAFYSITSPAMAAADHRAKRRRRRAALTACALRRQATSIRTVNSRSLAREITIV